MLFYDFSRRDLKTGEEWGNFCRRNDIDHMALSFGIAAREAIAEAKAKSLVNARPCGMERSTLRPNVMLPLAK